MVERVFKSRIENRIQNTHRVSFMFSGWNHSNKVLWLGLFFPFFSLHSLCSSGNSFSFLIHFHSFVSMHISAMLFNYYEQKRRYNLFNQLPKRTKSPAKPPNGMCAMRDWKWCAFNAVSECYKFIHTRRLVSSWILLDFWVRFLHIFFFFFFFFALFFCSCFCCF